MPDEAGCCAAVRSSSPYVPVSRGQYRGLPMVRSVNGGGAGGVATVGAAKAEGESARQSPGRQRDATLEAVANLAARRQARVQSEGLAPRVMPTSPRARTVPSRRKPLGRCPMSLAQGFTKGHSGLEDKLYSVALQPSGRVKTLSGAPHFHVGPVFGRDLGLPKNFGALQARSA